MFGCDLLIISCRESLKINGMGILWAGCPSRHPTNSIEAAKETRPQQMAWLHFFIHHWTPWWGRCVPASSLAPLSHSM